MFSSEACKAQSSKVCGQATLEVTVALIAVFILLLGTTQIFFWLNERMVLRQKAYESSRVAAGSSSSEIQVDESAFSLLDIFGGTN